MIYYKKNVEKFQNGAGIGNTIAGNPVAGTTADMIPFGSVVHKDGVDYIYQKNGNWATSDRSGLPSVTINSAEAPWLVDLYRESPKAPAEHSLAMAREKQSVENREGLMDMASTDTKGRENWPGKEFGFPAPLRSPAFGPTGSAVAGPIPTTGNPAHDYLINNPKKAEIVADKQSGKGEGKGKGEEGAISSTDSADYNNLIHGIDATVADKIIKNKKYDKNLKETMLKVARIQQKLKLARRYDGKVDGMWQDRTAKAYEAWKKDPNGAAPVVGGDIPLEEITGLVDRDQAEKELLFSQAGPAPEEYTKADYRQQRRYDRVADRLARQPLSGRERREQRREDRRDRREDFREGMEMFQNGGYVGDTGGLYAYAKRDPYTAITHDISPAPIRNVRTPNRAITQDIQPSAIRSTTPMPDASLISRWSQYGPNPYSPNKPHLPAVPRDGGMPEPIRRPEPEPYQGIGDIDPANPDSVRRFQRMAGVKVDGDWGPDTSAAYRVMQAEEKARQARHRTTLPAQQKSFGPKKSEIDAMRAEGVDIRDYEYWKASKNRNRGVAPSQQVDLPSNVPTVRFQAGGIFYKK